MAYAILATLFFLFSPVHAVRQAAASPQAAVLSIEAVRFEPVGQGRNAVHITVKNTGRQPEIFAVAINTRSPDYAKGVGWGTQFTGSIPAAGSKDLRFVYWVHGAVNDRTTISLSFYNPPVPDRTDAAFLLGRRRYTGAELPRAPERTGKPAASATRSVRATVTAVLRQAQRDLKSKRYADAWRAFSHDMCAVHFCQTESDFVKNVADPNSQLRPFLWPMDRFLAFQPSEARLADDGRVVLLGGRADPELSVHFVLQDGRWKIDDIAGYVPQVVLWAGWEQRLLPTMESRRSEHFDLFFEKGSTAARQADRIVLERESGYEAIAELLGISRAVRIRLVFFEDAAAKYRETGHQGAGWAYETTVVEVFNPALKLDPFHEVCHILSDGLGDPPALFNEGLAVYVSERLGAPALEQLGGGTLRIDDRVQAIRSEGRAIPLDAVIRFTEIGSERSKADISYPEAASFVKFLVEKFGKEKFLAAYKSLQNSGDAKVQEKNLKALRDIYGTPLPELEAAWLKGLERRNPAESR